MSYNLESLLPILQMVLSDGSGQKDPIYQSQAGAYALTYDYAPSLDVMSIIKQLMGVTPRENAPAFSFQYDMMRQKERTMNSRMQLMGDAQSPMMNALLSSVLESVGIENAYEMFADPMTGRTTFGGKAVNMITKTLLPSLTLPHQQIGEMSNIVYNAMAGLVPPDDEIARNRFGRGITREKSRDVVNQLLDATYTDESTTQTRGLWKASDMMEITRMSRDFGILRNTDSDDMAKKISNFGNVLQQAMGTFNVGTKEEGLKNLLDITGGSIDLTDTSKLRSALDKIKSLSEMTNLSVQVIKQVIEQGQEVSKQLGVSVGAGTNIALTSLNQWNNLSNESKGELPITQNEAVAAMTTFNTQIVSSKHMTAFNKVYGAAIRAGYTELADEMKKAQQGNDVYFVSDFEKKYQTKRREELKTLGITDTTQQDAIMANEKVLGEKTGEEAITEDNPFIAKQFVNEVINSIQDNETKQLIKDFNTGTRKDKTSKDYERAFLSLRTNLSLQLVAKGSKPEEASLLANSQASNYLNEIEVRERYEQEKKDRIKLSANIKSAELDRTNEATASHAMVKLLSGSSISDVWDDLVYGTTTKQLQNSNSGQIVSNAVEFQKFGWQQFGFKDKLTYAKAIYDGYVTNIDTFKELSHIETDKKPDPITNKELELYGKIANPTISRLQDEAIVRNENLSVQRAYELSVILNPQKAKETKTYIDALKESMDQTSDDDVVIQDQLQKANEEYQPGSFDARVQYHLNLRKKAIENFKDSPEYEKAKNKLGVDGFTSYNDMVAKLLTDDPNVDLKDYNSFAYETDANTIIENFDKVYNIDGKQLYQHKKLREFLYGVDGQGTKWKEMTFYNNALKKTGKKEFSSTKEMYKALQQVDENPLNYGQYFSMTEEEVVELNKMSGVQTQEAYQKNLERQKLNQIRGLSEYVNNIKLDNKNKGVIADDELKTASEYKGEIKQDDMDKIKQLTPFVGFDVALAMTIKTMSNKEEFKSIAKKAHEVVRKQDSTFDFKRNDNIVLPENQQTKAFAIGDDVADVEDMKLHSSLSKFFSDKKNSDLTFRFAQGKATKDDYNLLLNDEIVSKSLTERNKVQAFTEDDRDKLFRQSSFHAVNQMVASDQKKIDLRQDEIYQKFDNIWTWIKQIQASLSGTLKVERLH